MITALNLPRIGGVFGFAAKGLRFDACCVQHRLGQDRARARPVVVLGENIGGMRKAGRHRRDEKSRPEWFHVRLGMSPGRQLRSPPAATIPPTLDLTKQRLRRGLEREAFRASTSYGAPSSRLAGIFFTPYASTARLNAARICEAPPGGTNPAADGCPAAAN